MSSIETNSFEDRFKTILPQAVDHFLNEVARMHMEDPEYYDVNPKELLTASEHSFDIIVNNPYWLQHWQAFLLRMLIDEIYKDGHFEFSLN